MLKTQKVKHSTCNSPHVFCKFQATEQIHIALSIFSQLIYMTDSEIGC